MLKRSSGFTLLETIIAVFLLTFAAMMSAQMFRLALCSEAAAKDQSFATMIGESTLQQVQALSRNVSWWSSPTTPDGHTVAVSGAAPASTLDGAAACTGSTTTPWFSTSYPCPDDSRFTISIAAWRNVVHSPSRGASTDYGMTDSERLIRVTVGWRPDSANFQWPRSPSISLVGTVRVPDRTINAVSVTSSLTTVAAYNGSNSLDTITASATDAAGAAIPDVRFHFYLSPQSGNATLQGMRPLSASQTYLANFVILPQYNKGSGPRCVATGGTVSIHVRCVEGAKEAWATSPSIGLAQSISVTPPWPDAIFGPTPPWPWSRP